MKTEALQLIRPVADPNARMNLLREFLQALTLRSFHQSEAFRQIVFVGGTALRFIHDLKRFSEDLDFSVVSADGYAPQSWLRKLKTELTQSGFDPVIKWNDKTAVHKAWIRFPGILREAGLSPFANQNLSIKVEIDTCPPEGAVTERTLVDRHRLLALQHYDLPSLMAGKLHALITRPYPKGRDWYDLLWYRARRPPVEPNLPLLRNALNQTQGNDVLPTGEWRQLLLDRLDTLSVEDLLRDVQPFLERPEEKSLFNKETIAAAIRAT